MGEIGAKVGASTLGPAESRSRDEQPCDRQTANAAKRAIGHVRSPTRLDGANPRSQLRHGLFERGLRSKNPDVAPQEIPHFVC